MCPITVYGNYQVPELKHKQHQTQTGRGPIECNLIDIEVRFRYFWKSARGREQDSKIIFWS